MMRALSVNFVPQRPRSFRLALRIATSLPGSTPLSSWRTGAEKSLDYNPHNAWSDFCITVIGRNSLSYKMSDLRSFISNFL